MNKISLLCCLLLASCATTDSSVNVPGYLPLLGGYTVERNHYYPLSTAANLYVTGSDQELVGQLKSSLKQHFTSVADYPPATDHYRLSGFVIHIEQLGSQAGSNRIALNQKNLQHEEKRKIKYKVTVSDLHRDQPFDDVLVSLESRIFLSGSKQDMLSDAFDDLAARLSGRTWAKL